MIITPIVDLSNHLVYSATLSHHPPMTFHFRTCTVRQYHGSRALYQAFHLYRVRLIRVDLGRSHNSQTCLVYQSCLLLVNCHPTLVDPRSLIISSARWKLHAKEMRPTTAIWRFVSAHAMASHFLDHSTQVAHSNLAIRPILFCIKVYALQ
jgi:hypothetical protein